MQTISASLARAFRTGGQRRTLIDVTESFGTAKMFEDIPILEGTLTVDRNADSRRTATIKIGEKSLTDVFFKSHTGPFGLEIILRHGVVYPNQEEEYVQMGVFNIDGFDWEEGDGGWPVVNLYDRSRWIQRANLLFAVDYSGKFAQDVIEEVIAPIVPGLEIIFELGLPNARLPGGSIFDGSRWEVVQKCAEAMAAEAYFDHAGILRVGTIKDPTATIESTVWEFNVGEGYSELVTDASGNSTLVTRPDGILVSARRSISRGGTRNAVIVYGAAPDGTSAQPYGLAYDNDPQSPTYYSGTFGEAPHRIDNQLLITNDQCAEAAVAELKNRLGLARSVDFTALGNPALEAGDHILFTWSDGSQEVHLLDSYTYPLAEGEFSGSTRTNPSRQTASIGVEKGTFNADVPPTAPVGPFVHNVTTTTATLGWYLASPGSHPIERYEAFLNNEEVGTTDANTGLLNAVGLQGSTQYSFQVRAVDVEGNEGPLSSAVNFTTTGSVPPPPPPPKQTYTKTYAATWSASYGGNGTLSSWKGTKMYQGVVSGGNGNERSACGFDDARIRADTSGAEIVECKIKFHFEHWWSNAGGTAIIGTHNYSGRPGSWNSNSVKSNRVRSSGWPKPGTRTVNLGTTIGNEFKSGATKGIILGPAPSSSTEYYGYASGSGSGSLTPVLTIVYKK